MDADGEAPGGGPLSAPPNGREPGNGGPRDRRPRPPPPPPPRSLGEALREAGGTLDGSRAGSETPSEEDYDENVRHTFSTCANHHQQPRRRRPTPTPAQTQPPSLRREPHGAVIRDASGVHIIPENDKGIQDLLQRSSERIKDPTAAKKPGRFSGLVFTRQFSAFDPHNVASANSPFHGFYILFWLAVALFVFKISADNWRQHGTPLGSNEIMKTMFNRDGTSRAYIFARERVLADTAL